MIKDNYKNYMAAIIIALSSLKYYTTFFEMTSIVKYIMIVCLALTSILIISNIKKYNFIHFILFCVIIVGYRFSKNITLLYTFFICLGLYAADFKYIVKWFLIVNSLLFSIYLGTNLLGIHPSGYIDGRNDLGFGNPNTAFINMFIIWNAYFYLTYNNRKLVDKVILFLMIFLMFSQTNTKTGILAAIGSIIFYWIVNYIDVRKKIWSIIIALFPIAITILSLALSTVLSRNLFFNRVLSHRPLYWSTYISGTQKGLNLFGYPPNIREILFTARVPFDSGYMWTMYSQGIVAFTVLLIAISITLYMLCKYNRKAEIVLMSSLLIYSFAESILIDVTTNISIVLIVWGIYMLRNNSKKIDLKCKLKQASIN